MSGPVIAADDLGTDKVFDLDVLAAQILERDRIRANDVRTYWLLTGLDLLAAKRQVRHGDFGDWCKEKLQYSIRKAERLMQAADLFRPMAESDKLSFLPPKSLAYQLSAPSFPKQLRDEIVPQLLAGDRTALGSAREAVKKHKAAAKAKEGRETAGIERATDQPPAELELQAAARSAALDILTTELGNDLPKFLALAKKAGPDGVLSIAVQRELQVRLEEKTTPVEDVAAVVADEPEVADMETGPASVVSEGELPASLAPMNTADMGHATETIPDEAAAADVSLRVPNARSQMGHGKFGDLNGVVSTFPARSPGKRPRFGQSRGRA